MTVSYTTTTHGLRWLPGSNLVSDIDAGFQALAEDVDAKLLAGGKSIIATTETRTNTVFGLMTTPDRVQSVVMPTDGLLQIRFHATMRESVLNASRAAIFIGSNQLKAVEVGAPSPQVQAAANSVTAINTDFVVQSTSFGLVSVTTSTGYTGDVTTGQSLGVLEDASSGIAVTVGGSTVQSQNTPGTLWGGICEVFAAAGTYDISVQFNSTSGSITVKNRKLWVRAIDFA